MGILDYFKPVSTWTVDQVQQFIREHEDSLYSLVDVRQPKEYQQGHLPGARLIPVGQLGERAAELNPANTTILYCTAGVRSRAAASTLKRSGFPDVHSMAGGINAWHGLVAEGLPEAGIVDFTDARSVGEIASLAWLLEDGSQMFYENVASTAGDREAADLFRELVRSEEEHKALISGLFRDLAGVVPAGAVHPLPDGNQLEKIMEGGMRVIDAVAWANRKGIREVLEFAIALEAVSYDRYLALWRMAADDRSRAIYAMLAEEEKRHLGLLTAQFEKHH